MIDFDGLVLGASMETFGEMLDFLPVSGPPQRAMTGIFDENFLDTKFEDGNEVSTTKPMLGIRASAFLVQLPVQNDIFAIRGRLWRVQDVDADGLGHLAIPLMLATDSQASASPLPPTPPVTTL